MWPQRHRTSVVPGQGGQAPEINVMSLTYTFSTVAQSQTNNKTWVYSEVSTKYRHLCGRDVCRCAAGWAGRTRADDRTPVRIPGRGPCRQPAPPRALAGSTSRRGSVLPDLEPAGRGDRARRGRTVGTDAARTPAACSANRSLSCSVATVISDGKLALDAREDMSPGTRSPARLRRCSTWPSGRCGPAVAGQLQLLPARLAGRVVADRGASVATTGERFATLLLTRERLPAPARPLQLPAPALQLGRGPAWRTRSYREVCQIVFLNSFYKTQGQPILNQKDLCC